MYCISFHFNGPWCLAYVYVCIGNVILSYLLNQRKVKIVCIPVSINSHLYFSGIYYLVNCERKYCWETEIKLNNKKCTYNYNIWKHYVCTNICDIECMMCELFFTHFCIFLFNYEWNGETYPFAAKRVKTTRTTTIF